MSAPLPRQLPLITYALLGLNGLAFLFELSLGRDLEPFMHRWGTVAPDVRAYLSGADANPAPLVTILTATFLHAGWVHLAANMLYLWIFGARVEKALGSPSFLSLYLGAGVVAGICHVVAAPDVPVPAVGASGAIAGVLGAYLALYPGATIAALAPRFFYGRARDVSAAALLVLWLIAQLFTGVLAITDAGEANPIGWWAHVGGFAAGLLLSTLALGWRRGALYGMRGLRPAVGAEADEIERVEESRREWESG